MIWILLAIVVAGYLVGEGIKQSSASRIAHESAVKQAEIELREKELQVKEKIERGNSPLHQKHVNASLEFMDYIERYTLLAENQISHELQLLRRPEMTPTEKRKHKTAIDDLDVKMRSIQEKYFAKWDRLDKQIDPRRALLTSNDDVRVRYKIWQEQQDRLNTQTDELHKLRQMAKNVSVA